MTIKNKDTFKSVLENAISGDETDMGKILKLYNPLIKHQSYLCGKYDEDLNQEILLHLIRKIPKFRIDFEKHSANCC